MPAGESRTQQSMARSLLPATNHLTGDILTVHEIAEEATEMWQAVTELDNTLAC